MRLTVAPETVLERVILALGTAPVPLMETHLSFMRARAIMVGTKLGIFDALLAAPLSATDVADRCGTDRLATEKLLNALVGSRYLRYDKLKYRLSPVARKWIVRDSRLSLRDKILFEFIEWAFVERFEDYVRTGQPIEIHRAVSEQDWGFYQRAMRALAGIGAPEVVRRTPVPAHATDMLDIGGAHGFISVALCRRHPALKAVVLDLPDAVRQAEPILAGEGMGDRVRHWPADASAVDLGRSAWDIVFTSQLLHHLGAAANRTLAHKVAHALRPGGVFAVVEMIRPSSPLEAGQVGSLLDLYFALTSRSGTWSTEEITTWMREAGLVPNKPFRLRTIPGAVEIVARKPRV